MIAAPALQARNNPPPTPPQGREKEVVEAMPRTNYAFSHIVFRMIIHARVKVNSLVFRIKLTYKATNTFDCHVSLRTLAMTRNGVISRNAPFEGGEKGKQCPQRGLHRASTNAKSRISPTPK